MSYAGICWACGCGLAGMHMTLVSLGSHRRFANGSLKKQYVITYVIMLSFLQVLTFSEATVLKRRPCFCLAIMGSLATLSEAL